MTGMDSDLQRYLTKFEGTLDLDHLAHVREGYERTYAFEEVEELPYVLADTSGAPDQDWPILEYNDTFFDRQKMLLDQLRQPFLHHQLRDYHPINIRANYGTVILPSVMGAGYQLTETSLPWAHHLPDRDAIRRVIDEGVPDLESGLGQTCFETAEYYMDALAPYPKLTAACWIYHPDLQGPFDVAHLLWGPDILYGLYDCPDLVHPLLELVVETYIAWMHRWKALVGEGNDITAHWNTMMKGGIMIRDDTPVMLSPGHYEEFVKPYDQRLLNEFGGCIHFCGRGTQFIASMCASDGLYGIHSSQPELNDLDLLWRSTQEHKLTLITLPEAMLPCGARRGATLLRSNGTVQDERQRA
jgi:hypothetical protein